MAKMKRASYRAAIAWIADNDGDGDYERLEPEHVSFLISSVLVADLFDVDPERVGRDVIAYRSQVQCPNCNRTVILQSDGTYPEHRTQTQYPMICGFSGDVVAS